VGVGDWPSLSYAKGGATGNGLSLMLPAATEAEPVRLTLAYVYDK